MLTKNCCKIYLGLMVKSVKLFQDETSGKSKKTYSAENGINEATFYYWFSRIKGKETASGSFLTIDKISSKHEVEVIYPNGVRIKVEHDLALVMA